jgi:Cft2 family RNA processing exonuclease
MVKATLLGGAREIGASCTLLEAGDVRVVVDCGGRPNADGERAYPSFDRLRGGDVTAVVLTHAHYDHVGGLPILHRMFPDAPVIATAPTRWIAQTILEDSLSIQRQRGVTDYTRADLNSLFRAFVSVDDFDLPVTVAATESMDVTARFFRAGHILGAAMVQIDFVDRAAGRTSRVVISGDVSGFPQATIEEADIEAIRDSQPDLLILEGTYGTDEHGNMEMEEAIFVEKVADILSRGGRVVIPAFAVGRSQNLAVILHRAMTRPQVYERILGRPLRMPVVPVYVDGMCRTVANHYDAFRQMLHPRLLRERGNEPHMFFDSDGIVHCVSTRTERNDITAVQKPWVAISSSGMVNGGAVVPYVHAIARDPRSAILLVGYQDEESPGAALSRMRRRPSGEYGSIVINDRTLEIRCGVDQYRLSAHSDARDLERLCVAAAPKMTRLVHGDPGRLEALADRLAVYLSGRNLGADVQVGRPHEMMRVPSRQLKAAPPRTLATSRLTFERAAALTGVEAIGDRATAAATLATTASLMSGTQEMTLEEVSRLEVRGVSRASDVERIEAELAGPGAAAWQSRSQGPGVAVFRAAAGEQAGSFARLGRAARQKVMQAVHTSPAPGTWERLADEGVRESSLVVAVQHDRLVPFVLTGRTSYGYMAMGAEGEVTLPAGDILTRVAEWRYSAEEVAESVRVLRKLRDAFSDMDLAMQDDLDAVHRSGLLRDRVMARANQEIGAGRVSQALFMKLSTIAYLDGIVDGVAYRDVAMEIAPEGVAAGDEEMDVVNALADLGYLSVVQDEKRGHLVRLRNLVSDPTPMRERLTRLLGDAVAEFCLVAFRRALDYRVDRARRVARRAIESMDEEKADFSFVRRRFVA